MVEVKYEVYWNDFYKKFESRNFSSLEEFEKWMEKESRGGELYISPRLDRASGRPIQIRGASCEPVVWIEYVEVDGGIVFSNGRYTSDQEHIGSSFREELLRFREELRTREYNFVN